MLPYWYRQMIRDRGPGGQFIRAEGGEDIVYKHRDLFVIGQFTSGYHPVLNIRSGKLYENFLEFSTPSLFIIDYRIDHNVSNLHLTLVSCHGRRLPCPPLSGTSCILTPSDSIMWPPRHRVPGDTEHLIIPPAAKITQPLIAPNSMV